MKYLNRIIYFLGAFFSVTVPMLILMFASTARMIKSIFAQNRVL